MHQHKHHFSIHGSNVTAGLPATDKGNNPEVFMAVKTWIIGITAQIAVTYREALTTMTGFTDVPVLMWLM